MFITKPLYGNYQLAGAQLPPRLQGKLTLRNTPLFGKATIDSQRANDQFLNQTARAFLPLTDVISSHAQLLGQIETYQAKKPSELAPLSSQFLSANYPALFKTEPDVSRFHQRTRNLNDIKLFTANTDTEIAKYQDILKLPPAEKVRALTRLFAKRIIDPQTGNNLLTNLTSSQSSNQFKLQNLAIRLMRGQAATATIDSYPGKYIQDLYDELVGQFHLNKNSRPVTIHMVQPMYAHYADDYAVNVLATSAQHVITETLNEIAKRNHQSHLIQFKDDKQLPTLTRTARTHSGPIGRLVQQGYFDTSAVNPGEHFVVVDDHCQAGGATLSMSAAIQEAGGQVHAAITPSAHPYSRKLSMHPEVQKELLHVLKTWDTQGLVQQKLVDYGMPVNTLTNYEAMTVIAYATDPEDTKAIHRFHQLEGLLNQGAKVLEGESDSLKPVLKQKAASAAEVARMMEIDNTKNRKVIKPVPVKSVHVLDYDDFLRDEKGMNYQLMYNALVVAGQKYRTEYPFLAHLADKMLRTQGQYQPGMPSICKEQGDFARQAIQNDKYLKKDMITDMLAHLEGLDPQLASEYAELGQVKQKQYPNARKEAFEKVLEKLAKTKEVELSKALVADLSTKPEEPLTGQQMVENILWQEFKRQKQQMLEPRTREKQGENLPYPKIMPGLMPGAKELLETLRRPDTYVILRTNSLERDIEKESNLLGIAHYFDAVSGYPEQLVVENGVQTLRAKKFSKPNPLLLAKTLATVPNLQNVENFSFWGDTTKDQTQAFPLIQQGIIPANKVQFHLINPGQAVRKKLNTDIQSKIEEIPELRNLGRVNTAKSLLDPPDDVLFRAKL